jgi:hypothetical protein
MDEIVEMPPLTVVERNIVASALEMFHRDALRQATEHGLAAVREFHVDPAEVSTLISKIRNVARD